MISKFFIERPVLANVLAILMVVIGAVAVFRLPVAQYPNVTPPTVQVTTRYPGASARTVIDTVALPIEQQVNGVEGMLYMQSYAASDGTYSLTVTFAIGTDLNFAQVLVQNRVASALASLPQSVQAQGVTVQKRSTSILEIVTLTSSDKRHDSLFLANYGTIRLKDEISRLPGVGNVTVFGAGQYAMRVWLDPNLLQARSLEPQDVIQALQQQNQEVTAGQIGMPPAQAGQAFQYTLNVQGQLSDPEAFGNVIVKTGKSGDVTRVRDVGRVELGAQTYGQVFTLNGRPSAGLAIAQTPGANALDVAVAVNAKMKELAREFPPGLTYSVPFDTSTFVRESVDEVYKTLFEAGILVLIVIMVFLQDWRAMLVPATTVPVTIIGAFAAMAALGFSINLSTLFAIVLSIGIVVDDAIVVVEAVALNIEHGMSGRDAAIRAMNELIGPILGITLVLMSAFLPASFLPGLTGRMYAQFALVIAATALLSAINAATLKPTQSAAWLRPLPPPDQRNLFARGFNAVYARIERAYLALIARLIAFSGVLAVVALLIIAAVGYGFSLVPSGLLPIEDQGYLLAIVQLPDAASLGRTQDVLTRVSEIAGKTPGVDQVITIAGVSGLDNNASLANAGVAYIVLKPWAERGKGEDLRSLVVGLNGSLGAIEEARTIVLPPPAIQGIGNAAGATMQIELRDASFDLAKLQSAVDGFVAAGSTQTELSRVQASFRSNAPQYRLDINRVKTQTLGITDDQVFSVLSAALGSAYVGQFNKFGRTLQIYVQAEFGLPRAAGGHRQFDRAQRQRRHDPAWHVGDHHADHGALAHQPLQSLSLSDGHRAAGRWRVERRCDRPDGGDGRPDLAARRRLRVDRHVLPGEGHRPSDLLRVRLGVAPDLSRVGGAIRELARAVRRHLRRAIGDGGPGGRVERAQGRRTRRESLRPDRPRAADRAVRQERDPDRGSGAPADGAGRRSRRGRAPRGASAVSRHSDDVVRLHSRRCAAGRGDRRGGERAPVDRHYRVFRDDRFNLPCGDLRAEPVCRHYPVGPAILQARREPGAGLAR